ncbi:hypothetical protein B296_00000560, partial [Ensete ventricosum]
RSTVRDEEVAAVADTSSMASRGYEAARSMEAGNLKGGGGGVLGKEVHHGHGRTAHNMSSSSLRKKSDLSLVSKVRCSPLRALLANLQEIFLGTKLFVLFPAVPLAIAANYFHFGRAWLFALSLLGLTPLAERVSFLTEQIAFYTGPTGTHMFLLVVPLHEAACHFLCTKPFVLCHVFFQHTLPFILLTTCSCILQKQADVNTGLLLLGALCHILLLMFRYAVNTGEQAVDAAPTLALSRACSIIMLLAYVAYLFFQLKTHRRLFESREEDDEDDDDVVSEDEPVIGFASALIWLVGMTVVIALLSEYVVGTIEVYINGITDQINDINAGVLTTTAAVTKAY